MSIRSHYNDLISSEGENGLTYRRFETGMDSSISRDWCPKRNTDPGSGSLVVQKRGGGKRYQAMPNTSIVPLQRILKYLSYAEHLMVVT